MNQPFMNIDTLIQIKDPEEMYKRSAEQKLDFNQFIEWIEKDVQRSLFCQDGEFSEREGNYVRQSIKRQASQASGRLENQG